MRPDRDRLEDMLAAAETALRLASQRSVPARDDDPVVYAITYQLIVIGEAARAVSAEARGNLSDLAWSDIVAMRNFIVHAYWRIDEARLWRTVEVELPSLIAVIGAFLSAAEDQ